MFKSLKLISEVLLLTMIFTLLPNAPVVQASDEGNYYYKYSFIVTTSESGSAGTKSGQLYAVLSFYDKDGNKPNSNTLEVTLTGEGVTKKGKNAYMETGYTTYEPWCLAGITLKNRCDEAYRAYRFLPPMVEIYEKKKINGVDSYVHVQTYSFNWKDGGIYYYPNGTEANQGKWIDNGDEHATKIKLPIDFSGNGEQTFAPTTINGWSDFSKNEYLDVDTTSGTVSKNITGKFSSGAYTSLNFWRGEFSSPEMTFIASGKGVKQNITWDNLTSNEVNAIDVIKTNGKISGYTINKKEMASYMNKLGINVIEIKTNMKFKWWAFSDRNLAETGMINHGSDNFSRTCYIYRKAIEIESITVQSGTPNWKSNNLTSSNSAGKTVLNYNGVTENKDGLFENFDDNLFFNRKAEMIAVTVKFKKTNNFSHLNNDFWLKNYPTTVPKLQIGYSHKNINLEMDQIKLKSGEWTNLSASNQKLQTVSSDGKITYFYKIAGKEIDSEDVGMTLWFDDFSIGGYKLTKQQLDYTISGNNAGDLECFESAYKVDTVQPTIDASLSNNTTEINGWRKRAIVNYTPSEDLHNSFSESDGKSLNQTFSWIYSDTKSSDVPRLVNKNNSATNFEKAAAAKDYFSRLDLELADNKEIEGVIYIVGSRDIAKNILNFEPLIYVNLDSLAPRLEIVRQENYDKNEGSKSMRFDFTLQDASKSGKVYYTFSKNATAPEFDTASEAFAETNIIESLYDKWAFLNQQPENGSEKDTKDPTNGCAILKVSKGDEFNGYIHYFTEDGFGNKSEIKSQAINIDNPDVKCVITTSDTDVSKPLKNYDINIAASEGEIYYKWKHPSQEGYLTSYQKYTLPSKTGSGIQLDKDGNEVVMNGECTLCVMVKVGDLETTFEKKFAFDNAAPTIRFTNLAMGSFKKAHTIDVSANDPSGIVSANAQLITLDDKVIATYEISPKEGILDADISVQGIESGAYKIRASVTDKNGDTTTKDSNVFYIRNQAPVTTVRINSEKTIGDVPLLTNKDYTINIEAFESFVSPVDEQHLYYRFTEDTDKWGSWTMSEKAMEKASDGHRISFEVTPPDLISEGTNLIYLQTVIAPVGVNPTNLDEITTTSNIIVMLDTLAPSPRLDLTDMHTNKPIIGTLYLGDLVSNEFTIDKGDTDDSLLLIEPAVGEDELEIPGQYTITVKDNIDTAVFASDLAGNMVEIPIKITGFDFTGPKITSEAPVAIKRGERIDTYVNITINDALKESERFALIPEADIEDALDDNGKIKEKYFTDYSGEDKAVVFENDFTAFKADLTGESLAVITAESKLLYTISLSGVSGNYYVGVQASDSIDNYTDVILETPLSPVNAEISLLGDISVSPKAANTKARVEAKFNVPVYIMPQNMITSAAEEDLTLEETNFEIAKLNATGFSEVQHFIIGKTGTYKMYVVDELGRTALYEAVVTDDMVSFGNQNIINAETVVLSGFIGGTGGTDLDFDETLEGAYRVISGNEMVSHGYYHNEDSTYGTFTAVEVTAPEGVYLMHTAQRHPQHGFYLSDEEEGLDVWEYMNEQFLADPTMPEKGYKKLYYLTSMIWDSETDLPVDKNERSAVIKYRTDADPEGVWTEHTVTVGNIDNTPPEAILTLNPATVRDDDTNPTLYTLSDVTAEIKVSDPHTGLKYIVVDIIPEYNDGSSVIEPFEIDTTKIDPSGVVIDNEQFKMTITGEYDENGNDLNPKGIKTVNITFKDNVNIIFTTVNTVGGFGMIHNGDGESINIDYINKIDISESDYTVKYFYEDYTGTWQPAAEGIYYKKAKAVITPTEAGAARGLTVSNNGGLWEKLLTEFDYQFTFVLRDQYGYSVEVPVTAYNFDNEAGSIEYELSTLEKTNKPIGITIKVSDETSGVGSVTLERKLGDQTEAIALTDNKDGTYSGQLTNTGSYTITMVDNVGNMAQKSFVATNIDSIVPEIAEVKWNVESGKRTSGSLVAELVYSKPGVSITRITPATDIKTNDFIADNGASIIRFFENGSINVWFTDEYGNEGYGLVTADQIYRNPPALIAIATVTDDKQRVDITFDKATDPDTGVPNDPYRELSDVMVKYHGIVHRADEALFSFTENGTYTFEVYDDEGISSNITIEITGIDKNAPTITQVRWSYDYDVLENGEWVTKSENASWQVGSEKGYVIATDKYNVTNKDVSVTITTDEETQIMGDNDSVLGTEHTLEYFENGMYIFNAAKKNGMYDSYGFQVEIIDKTPPVLEVTTPEIIFYENPDANEKPYSKDMIIKSGVAFNAYDLFKGETDLGDRVEIDLGGFNADDITQNVFDRTKPYTIKYKVSDDAHNITETTMIVRLVGYNDSIAIVNDKLPDYAGRIELAGAENIDIKLGNFSGKTYARVKKGVFTMGEMKKSGEVIEEASPGTGQYIFKPDQYDCWYTFLIQTDKRDYFNIRVFFKK